MVSPTGVKGKMGAVEWTRWPDVLFTVELADGEQMELLVRVYAQTEKHAKVTASLVVALIVASSSG